MAFGKTITSANSVFALSVPGLFNTPVVLQGYAADDAFSNDAVTTAEVQIGVDGHLSAGYVFQEVKQKIKLSADSISKVLFDEWYNASRAAREVISANATVTLPSTGESYVLTNGYLTSYPALPAAKRKLDPVEFEITWESAIRTAI